MVSISRLELRFAKADVIFLFFFRRYLGLVNQVFCSAGNILVLERALILIPAIAALIRNIYI